MPVQDPVDVKPASPVYPESENSRAVAGYAEGLCRLGERYAEDASPSEKIDYELALAEAYAAGEGRGLLRARKSWGFMGRALEIATTKNMILPKRIAMLRRIADAAAETDNPEAAEVAGEYLAKFGLVGRGERVSVYCYLARRFPRDASVYLHRAVMSADDLDNWKLEYTDTRCANLLARLGVARTAILLGRNHIWHGNSWTWPAG